MRAWQPMSNWSSREERNMASDGSNNNIVFVVVTIEVFVIVEVVTSRTATSFGTINSRSQSGGQAECNGRKRMAKDYFCIKENSKGNTQRKTLLSTNKIQETNKNTTAK
jgi:hypothetical protein